MSIKANLFWSALMSVGCLMGVTRVIAQDSLWIRYDDRFQANKQLMSIAEYDSIEFSGTTRMPVLKCYTPLSDKGYYSVYLPDITGSKSGTLMLRNPGRIVYKPNEFSTMDFMDNSSRWSFERSRESEHFIVFWEKDFGSNPNSSSLPANMRVNINDLLEKAEKFYTTNVERLQMVNTGNGQSRLDKYKMEIYLLYQSEWLATGSGYDDRIGALWVNPTTCQPVASTIGHEIGHSFQYQTYCDNLLRGRPNDHQSGFRYGLPESNGNNGFWEQCAQWQSYQDYPSEALSTHHFSTWIANHHRHFEHQAQRYASYWLHYYLTELNGLNTIGRIWNESKYPEDALMAYSRLFCDDDYELVKKQLFEYAQRAVTFDFEQVRQYVTNQYDSYRTDFVPVDNNWWQVAFSRCPVPTGFNVIPLVTPPSETKVVARLQGLAAGSPLVAGDQGTANDDGTNVTLDHYTNHGVKGNEGWMFGFVALKDDGTRVYGDAHPLQMDVNDGQAETAFTVPDGVHRLWLVVQGAPKIYQQCPWDNKESNDDQLPYRVQVEGTDISGYITIDADAQPVDTTIVYDLACNSSSADYVQGTVHLTADGALTKIGKAFALQPFSIASITDPISNGVTAQPSEGRIVLALESPSGKLNYNYTANGGFYCKADGNVGSWGNNDPIWVEYDRNAYTFSYGHKPGFSKKGKLYTIRPVLVYTKGGKQYRARIVMNLQF